jgi:NADPH-dependent curcumin reductase CurA
MSPPAQGTHLVLAERPKGPITTSTFSRKSVPIPAHLEPDNVLVRVDWVSLDPAMRSWINDYRSYVPPVQIGETMRAQGLGTVVKGGRDIKVGDTVRGMFGSWPELIMLIKFETLCPFLRLVRLRGGQGERTREALVGP